MIYTYIYDIIFKIFNIYYIYIYIYTLNSVLPFLQITSYTSPNLERFEDNHAQEDIEKPVGWCARKYDPPWHEFTCKRWLVLCARGGQVGSYGYVPMQARLAGL